jgi:hypothetical protein
MKNIIVIARYNENISWANDYENVVIYNKGENVETKHSIIVADNIGKEAHTYLQYVIDNYHDLPDVVAFMQGDPFYHISSLWVEEKITPDLFNDYFFNNIENGFSKNWVYGRMMHFAPPYCVDWFKMRIDKEDKVNVENMKIFWAACFSVTKEQILKRPYTFYQELHQQFNDDDRHVENYNRTDWTLAHWFERSWYYIFNE